MKSPDGHFPAGLIPTRVCVGAGGRNERKNKEMKHIKPHVKKAAALAVATSIGAASAFAQSSGGSSTTFADPSTITTTATTVFTGVATLMVGIVGFWVILKIVRKIAGK
jgi:putative Mn2+ efflux pump MntP